MKITSKTEHTYVDLYDYDDSCRVEYLPSGSDPVSRVIIFPEVWRANGKKYKVTTCSYSHNGGLYDKVTVRIPRAAGHFIFYCEETIELY